MKIKMIVISVLALFVLGGIAHAAPVDLRLVQTSALFNEDPPGAPLPLGRTQYDSGDIQDLNGTKVGEYYRVKDIGGTLNNAAITITLFFGGSDPAFPITLQGSHSFNNGNAIGSISATGVGSIPGVPFEFNSSTGILTLFFP